MKEKSLMVVIPTKNDDIKFDSLMENLKSNGKIIIRKNEKAGANVEKIDLMVEGRDYEVNVFPSRIDIPPFMRRVHEFSDADFQKIDQVDIGLGVEIEFSGDSMRSFMDQLIIVDSFLPEKLAVLDVSSEKILSDKWVRLATRSKVLPSPRYLFTVQAVSGENDEVWLHSHGMKRCGLPELEILGSNKNMYSSHYSVIETIAVRMIEKGEANADYEAIFLAWLTDKIPLVTTLTNWQDALGIYPNIQMGRKEDRDDYHMEGTKVISIYGRPENIEKHIIAPIQLMDDLLGQNTMLMISDKETDRMRKLAFERLNYVRKEYAKGNSETKILLKIGLPVDKEFRQPDRDPNTQREHIWFELDKISTLFSKEKFVCTLTQDPYYVKKMKTGDTGKYDASDITDWLILTKERRYTSDDVYLLD